MVSFSDWGESCEKPRERVLAQAIKKMKVRITCFIMMMTVGEGNCSKMRRAFSQTTRPLD